MKRFFAAAMAVVMVCSFAGCSIRTNNAMESYDFKEMSMEFIQLSPPKTGDTIAVIDTDFGEVRVVLYEQYAPNTVKAFVDAANAGKYNDMPIMGVTNDVFFLTGGSENKKGQYIGRTDDSELIANEYTPELWPFTGSLMSYSEKEGFSDLRWFICNTDNEGLTEDAINELKSNVQSREDEVERDKLTALFDKFYEIGGVFGLAGRYTVFGQTYEGLDVVEKLTRIPTDSEGRASDKVMIKSVTITQY